MGKKSNEGTGDEKQRWEEAVSEEAEKATVNTKFPCKVQSRSDSTVRRLQGTCTKLARGEGRVTAEKKRSKKVYARQGVGRDSRHQGGKEQVYERIKILAFLKGTMRVSSLGDISAFSDSVGNCRLTKTLQGFTVSRRRIPGTPPGSFSVVFRNDYRWQKWTGWLSYRGKRCRGWLSTGLEKKLCCTYKSWILAFLPR